MKEEKHPANVVRVRNFLEFEGFEAECKQISELMEKADDPISIMRYILINTAAKVNCIYNFLGQFCLETNTNINTLEKALGIIQNAVVDGMTGIQKTQNDLNEQIEEIAALAIKTEGPMQ